MKSTVFLMITLLCLTMSSGYLHADIEQEISEYYLTEVTPDWLNYFPGDVYIDGNYAFVAGWYSGIHIFDISNPENPFWIMKIDVEEPATDIYVENGYMYLPCGGLRIYDIDPLEDAHIVKSIESEDIGNYIDVKDGFAYVYGWKYLTVIDISPPEDAHVVKQVKEGG